MSDPTARRGDNIMALLKEMIKSKRGWTKTEMTDFLFMRYRTGVREQTLESIFNQLRDRAIIYAKPVTKHSPNLRWYVNVKRWTKLTGVSLS